MSLTSVSSTLKLSPNDKKTYRKKSRTARRKRRKGMSISTQYHLWDLTKGSSVIIYVSIDLSLYYLY